MTKIIRIVVGAALGAALVAGSITPALALRNADEITSVRKLDPRGSASAPLGLMVFCLKQPAYCKGSGASEVRMSADLMRALNGINSRVNRSIRPRHDKGDTWSINVRYGDCEDYVLTKRAELIKLGLPSAALRIATARTRSGEGHAVLVVRTNEGDYVLDNRTRSVKEWHRTGLNWIAMSDSSPRKWRRL